MHPSQVTLDDIQIDCHCHVFHARSFPTESFIAMCLRRWVKQEVGQAASEIAGLVRVVRTAADLRDKARSLFRRWRKEWVGPGGVDLAAFDEAQGGIEHVAAFISTMVAGSEDALIKELLPPEHAHVACAPLMMDLDSAMPEPDKGADERWQGQVETCSRLAAEYPGRAFPFYAVHPRRAGVVDAAIEAVSERGFFGIKIYPPLGYAPSDPRLMELYSWCERSGVPVTSHCSQIGVWSDLDVPEGRDPMKHNVALAAPQNWVPVLEAFPELRVNLAHFGGQWGAAAKGSPSPWVDTAVDMLERYPNCYADLSYHVTALHSGREVRRAYFDKIRALMHSDIGAKLLWGTDHVILRTRCRRDEYCAAFAPPTGGLSPSELRQIANTNPRRFLGLDSLPERYARFAAGLDRSTMPQWLAEKLDARSDDA